MGLHRWSRKAVVLALASVLALGLAGAAIAQSINQGPRTDDRRATFDVTVTDQAVKTCRGQDGQYLEIVELKARGPIVADDPRLSGELTISRASALVQLAGDDPVDGTAEGHFEVRNDAGRVTSTGNFDAAIENGEIKGVAVGRITGPAQEQGGKLVANFSASGTDPVIVGEVGAESGGSTNDPAVIQSGHCQGPAKRAP